MSAVAAVVDTPADAGRPDLEPYLRVEPNGDHRLHMLVDGMHCAGCQNRIERKLGTLPGVVEGRVNLTARRLALRWDPDAADAGALVDAVEKLGFRLVPYDPAKLGDAFDREQKRLLRAMAVAGFAAANIMLLSVSIWAGLAQDMQPTTRALMHWISALIAVPAVAYAGMPFFESALIALRARALNMDVPISLAVLLATGMSIAETMRGAEHAYFDSAVALLFFLLVGRFLDRRVRGRARSAAAQLLALDATAVTVEDAHGHRRVVQPAAVEPGMRVLVAAGGRVPVDGRVIDGVSDIDTSLITGESVPETTRPGSNVFAGTLNLTAPLALAATAAAENTLLAEIGRLLEAAEQRRARYVALAGRIVRYYAPTVHILAAATFLGWLLFGAVGWQAALLTAVAVLIITCPCALALAVPVVQVVAGNRLFRQGVLVKSATALERLAQIDTVVFDKTGTLTEGRPELVPSDGWNDADLAAAAALAAASNHPLARAIAAAAPEVRRTDGVEEVPGHGLRLMAADGEIRLGKALWCGGNPENATAAPAELELWLSRPGRPPVRFGMRDRLRVDAAEVVTRLEARGLAVEILSGDRTSAVEAAAQTAGISEWRAGQSPQDKIARLEALARQGRRVCMVGDGLNDAPALAAAFASMSPASAADISQTAADLVFQRAQLMPVLEALTVARRADRLVRQNFGLAFVYNAVMVPVAMAGFVTPLIAALAMSSSSIVVIANALRLGRQGKGTA
jgi:Cu2+-exporting ATPase